MHFSYFGEKNFISWTLLISFLTFGHSDSVDLSDKSEGKLLKKHLCNFLSFHTDTFI
jgi:hypothetical protein